MMADRCSPTVIAHVLRLRAAHTKLDTLDIAKLANAALSRQVPCDITEADVAAILHNERERARQVGGAA